MSLPRLKADFVARRGPAVLPLGFALLGMAAVGAVLIARHSIEAEAAGLELRLAAMSPATTSKGEVADQALEKEARSITQRLGTPWSVVLDDLEVASHDDGNSIAVLSVKPDRDTRRVTLVAEARSLSAALNYVQRLQQSRSLSHPMLESHEERTDSAERPVRIQITAEWKLTS